MRSYPLTLTSAYGLFPTRLVEFVRLDGGDLRVAEADESITVSAQTFTPLPGAEISAVKHILNGDMPSMEVRFAHSVGGVFDTSELNKGFWDGASVVVYVVDRSSLTTLGDPLFTGIIDTVTLDPVGSSGSFDIRGLAAQGEAFIQTYQPMDRTDLFSVLNQLDPDDWDQAGTVGTIIDNFNVIIDGLGSPPADGYYNNGVFQTASGFKGHVANWIQSSRKLTTYQPVCVSRLTEGEAITLYAGYDKTVAQARDKFSDIINFQGEPHFLGIKSILGQ